MTLEVKKVFHLKIKAWKKNWYTLLKKKRHVKKIKWLLTSTWEMITTHWGLIYRYINNTFNSMIRKIDNLKAIQFKWIIHKKLYVDWKYVGENIFNISNH